MKRALRVLPALVVGYVAVQAQASIVVNGSFEDGEYPTGDPWTRLFAGDNRLAGWTVGGLGIDWHDAQQMNFPHTGDKVVDLNLSGEGSGTLSQSFATTVGQTYLLTFYLSGPDPSPGAFPDPREVQVDIAGIQQVFSTPASLHTQLVWGKHQLAFQAVADQTTLTFSSLDGRQFWGPVLDDISVTSPIPEASAFCIWSILTVGSAVAFGRRFQRE
jgi:choice-of-anchor C domain-containing protein